MGKTRKMKVKEKNGATTQRMVQMEDRGPKGQDVHTVWQVELIDTWKHVDQQWAPKGPGDQNSPIVDYLLILDIYFIFMKLLFDINGYCIFTLRSQCSRSISHEETVF